jgi:transcriptional regulator with XRE-family HTH domain
VPLTAQQSAFLAAVGGNVRRLRVARKLTQEALAELVGVNPRTVQKIEAGRLNILVTTLARLQSGLRCSWDDLMDDSK